MDFLANAIERVYQNLESMLVGIGIYRLTWD